MSSRAARMAMIAAVVGACAPAGVLPSRRLSHEAAIEDDASRERAREKIAAAKAKRARKAARRAATPLPGAAHA